MHELSFDFIQNIKRVQP